jgi:hypothetical protein
VKNPRHAADIGNFCIILLDQCSSTMLTTLPLAIIIIVVKVVSLCVCLWMQGERAHLEVSLYSHDNTSFFDNDDLNFGLHLIRYQKEGGHFHSHIELLLRIQAVESFQM